MKSHDSRITKTVKLRPDQRADHAEMVEWVSAQPAVTWQEALTAALLYYVRRHSALHRPLDPPLASEMPPETTRITSEHPKDEASMEHEMQLPPTEPHRGNSSVNVRPRSRSAVNATGTRDLPSITDFDDDEFP